MGVLKMPKSSNGSKIILTDFPSTSSVTVPDVDSQRRSPNRDDE